MEVEEVAVHEEPHHVVTTLVMDNSSAQLPPLRNFGSSNNLTQSGE
jgi:hypothetical protein